MILTLKENFKISYKIYYKILNHFIIINKFNTFNIIKHFKKKCLHEMKITRLSFAARDSF